MPASRKKRKGNFKDTSRTFLVTLDHVAHPPSSSMGPSPVAVVDRVSADYRRTLPQTHKIRPPTPPPEPFFDDSDLFGEEESIMGPPSMQPVHTDFTMDPIVERRKHCTSSVSRMLIFNSTGTSSYMKDNELRQWASYRAEYLNELVYLEGFRGFSKERCMTCSGCSADSDLRGEPLYRCRECFIGQAVCKSCCLLAHSQQPLHVIEVRVFLIYAIY